MIEIDKCAVFGEVGGTDPAVRFFVFGDVEGRVTRIPDFLENRTRPEVIDVPLGSRRDSLMVSEPSSNSSESERAADIHIISRLKPETPQTPDLDHSIRQTRKNQGVGTMFRPHTHPNSNLAAQGLAVAVTHRWRHCWGKVVPLGRLIQLLARLFVFVSPMA